MKHKFSGIGSASATLTFIALAGTPLAFLTQGFLGKIVHWLLTQIFMRGADKGLIFLNIGAAKAQTLSEHAQFDGSLDEAFKIINEKKGNLSEEDVKKVDDSVIATLRKFTDFGVRNN